MVSLVHDPDVESDGFLLSKMLSMPTGTQPSSKSVCCVPRVPVFPHLAAA